jgi:signal transduction histidine kinase
MRSRYWKTVTLAGFAVYSLIAVLGSISTVVYWNQVHFHYDATQFVANRFLEQYTSALFVAPLFWLVDRVPLTRPHRRRNAAVLLVAIGLFILLKYAVFMPAYRLWTGVSPDGYWLQVLENAVPVAFGFAAIIGVAHALRYHRDATERERAASELKTQIAQARLDTLRGQLHPRFIYNAVSSAAALMREDVDAADQMLTQLGELLRMSLDRSSTEVTLDEEMSVAQRYLAITRRRFSDRLTVSCAADDDVRKAMVPSFIMQPLIENALEHSVVHRPGPGRVDITARRVNGSLEVVVEDDGPGVTLFPTSPRVMGLANTHARLQHLYGKSHAFALEPAPSGGARAVVRIPFREGVTL